MEFSVERTIAGGFLKKNEWLETEVDHLTARLRLCHHLSQGKTLPQGHPYTKTAGKTEVLDERHFKTLGSGRQELSLRSAGPDSTNATSSSGTGRISRPDPRRSRCSWLPSFGCPKRDDNGHNRPSVRAELYSLEIISVKSGVLGVGPGWGFVARYSSSAFWW